MVFIDDASYGIEAATVTLHAEDGRVVSHHVGAARGSLGMPLSDGDLSRKLEKLAAWGGSQCPPAPLLEALWSLDRRDDAGSLMPLAAGRS